MLDKLRQLSLKVEGFREPIGRQATSSSAGDGGQAVLHRDETLTRELVKHHMRPLLAQRPVRQGVVFIPRSFSIYWSFRRLMLRCKHLKSLM